MGSNGRLVYASGYDRFTVRSIAPHKIPKTLQFPQFSNVPATPRLRSSPSVNSALAGCRPRRRHPIGTFSFCNDRIGKVAGLRSHSRLAADSGNNGADSFRRMSGDVYQPASSLMCGADFAGGFGSAGGNSDGSAAGVGVPPGYGKE